MCIRDRHNNTIRNHKTAGISIASWLFTGTPYESKDYDPYCTNIHIHDNTIQGTQGPPDATTDFGKLMTALFQGQAYDIVIDGIFDPASLDDKGNPTGFCFSNNGDISFVNLNAGKGMTPEEMIKNMKKDDLTNFNCTLDAFNTADHDKWLAVK